MHHGLAIINRYLLGRMEFANTLVPLKSVSADELLTLAKEYRPRGEIANIDSLIALKRDGIEKLRCIAEFYHISQSASKETRYDPEVFMAWWDKAVLDINMLFSKLNYLKKQHDKASASAYS